MATNLVRPLTCLLSIAVLGLALTPTLVMASSHHTAGTDLACTDAGWCATLHVGVVPPPDCETADVCVLVWYATLTTTGGPAAEATFDWNGVDCDHARDVDAGADVVADTCTTTVRVPPGACLVSAENTLRVTFSDASAPGPLEGTADTTVCNL